MTYPRREPEEPAPLAPPPVPEVKARVEIAADGGTVVVKEQAGELNWRDKLKGYYKGIIAAVGALLLLINQITPVTSVLGEDMQQWVNVAIVFLTAVATFLKSNEQWIQKL